jgi:hypothetical protein
MTLSTPDGAANVHSSYSMTCFAPGVSLKYITISQTNANAIYKFATMVN